MPSERTEVAVAAVDGKVYVIGGLNGERELEIFDPQKWSWSRGAPFPRMVHHAAAVGSNGKLYVLGGFADGGWTPTDATYEYDPVTDRWAALASMPTARGALAAAVLGGRIHAVGGTARPKADTNAHEAYDPATNSWATLSPLPTPRDHLAAATLGGKIFAIGGRVGGNYRRNLGMNEVYDPTLDRWEPKAPLPTPRSGIVAVPLEGEIFVVGGEAPTGTFAEVESYDPTMNSWTSRAPLPTPRHGLGAAVVSGKLYVLGGGPRPGASASAANEIYQRRGE